MANRRMFSKRVTNSAKFLKMTPSAQNLYFHLCMEADDDGIVEAFSVMQILSCSEDDLKALVGRKFIRVLNEDLVSVILDWNEHNLIRSDRKINSIYKDLLIEIAPEIELIEPKPRTDTGKYTGGRPMDVQWTTNGRLRLGEVRVGEDKKLLGREARPREGQKVKIPKMTSSDFDLFWQTYPNKKKKPKAKEIFLRIDKDKLLKIIEAVEVQKKTPQWSKDGGRFIPHPTTWLNQGQWDDQEPEVEVNLEEQIKADIKNLGDQAKWSGNGGKGYDDATVKKYIHLFFDLSF